jgi:nitrite reductase/ring-hydroxylating ferredoxin subunit/uncharacterized membrane protein
MDLRSVGDRLEASAGLDPIVEAAHRGVDAVLPRGPVKDSLHGVWLGHPLHPLLTDLPIGFWTSAWVFDLVGGRRTQPAADVLIGLGVATALPTAVAGLADWSELKKPEQRTGLVHAACNLTATALYAVSLLARRRGARRGGVMLAMAGATAATAGGFLGGHLSFRRGAGVNAAAGAPSLEDWTEVQAAGDLTAEQPTALSVDRAELAGVETSRGPAALYARCSHEGGPLEEGDLVDGCIRCPWHASRFRMDDGSVVSGPATAPQPVYELRRDGERLLARRRPS